jgi:hypothetical protein
VEPLLQVADVTALLRTTPRAIYELAESRDPAVRLPQVRLGRRLLFRADDIRDYVERRAVTV